MNATSTSKILSASSGFNFTSCFGEDFTCQLYMSQESVKPFPIIVPLLVLGLHSLCVSGLGHSSPRRPSAGWQTSLTFENLLENSQAKTDTSTLNKLGLSYFQASLFATALEDALCSLLILEECNNGIRVIKTNVDMKQLLARKFAVPQRVGGDELDNIDATKLNCLDYKLQKLEDDRKYVRDIFLGTYTELCLERYFSYMSQRLNAIEDLIEYRETLVEEEANNRILRRELNRQLRHQRNHIKSVYYDTDIIIENLRTNVEDAGLNTRVRSRYVDNWQRARTEQHLQTIRDSEKKPLATIKHYKRRTDQEHRVHTEVELLEKLEKIEEWMNRYDKDMEAIDLKIQKKRNQLEDMKKKTAALEETIEEHARLCKNWVTFKDEREKARQYREKMTNAAISIQAWWRGLLVRNQLGPYKPMKRPPPPPPGKKKK